MLQDCVRSEGYFETGNGRKLFFRSWQPERAERFMVLVHGFGEHSGRYEEVAMFFAERGFSVYAHDQMGHGHSPGQRGHVGRFDDFLDDVEEFISFASESHPGLPSVLVGHSMGGLVVAALACEREVDMDLVVLSGPALSLSPDISRSKLIFARLLRRLAPRFSMAAGLEVSGISRDPEVVRNYEADPLVHGQITASMGAGMFEAIERVSGKANKLSVPALLMHGEADPICRVEGSQLFFDSLSQDGAAAGSELRIYPNLRHEIFNEPERVRVYDDVHDWILRLGSP